MGDPASAHWCPPPPGYAGGRTRRSGWDLVPDLAAWSDGTAVSSNRLGDVTAHSPRSASCPMNMPGNGTCCTNQRTLREEDLVRPAWCGRAFTVSGHAW